MKFSVNKLPAEGKDFYYVYCSSSLGKNLVVLECRREMIKNISLYVAKDVMERDI